jgi:hypothetical protein
LPDCGGEQLDAGVVQAGEGFLQAESGSLVPDVIPTSRGSQVPELTRDPPLDPCYCVTPSSQRRCGSSGYNAETCAIAELYLSSFG